ncbi:hypothetical protein H6504_00660 [Candidatus Woesearchaeota archaeon]|nr:hypothetical protein [Candidatus Woesearchaeota archaeon]
MDKTQATKAIAVAKQIAPKRNFKQRIDMIVAIKGIDLKKNDQQIDFFAQLHYPIEKRRKICGLVGPELYEQAQKAFDKAILVDDFDAFTKKKDIKKLADEHDFFVAQGNIMNKVAATFGRVFGPRGKMPNPKGGCVVPPNANLTQVAERLQKVEQVKIKNQPMVQLTIGYEDTDEKVVVDNALTLFDQLVHHLPQEKNNIKCVYLKLTMGKTVKVGDEQSAVQATQKE